MKNNFLKKQSFWFGVRIVLLILITLVYLAVPMSALANFMKWEKILAFVESNAVAIAIFTAIFLNLTTPGIFYAIYKEMDFRDDPEDKETRMVPMVAVFPLVITIVALILVIIILALTKLLLFSFLLWQGVIWLGVMVAAATILTVIIRYRRYLD